MFLLAPLLHEGNLAQGFLLDDRKIITCTIRGTIGAPPQKQRPVNINLSQGSNKLYAPL